MKPLSTHRFRHYKKETLRTLCLKRSAIMRHHEINSPPISISIPPPAIGQHPHILSRLHDHHHHTEKENCETCSVSSLNLGNVQTTGSTTSCTFSEIPLEKKHLLLRKMLIVLLHAKFCREKDMNNNDTEHGHSNSQPCPVPFCDLLKGVLSHLIGCTVAKGCTFKHCSTSRLILEHWLHCEDKGCPMCEPVRKTFEIGTPFSKSKKSPSIMTTTLRN